MFSLPVLLSWVLAYNEVRGQGPIGVQLDSTAVQTEEHDKVPVVDERFFFCVASDSVGIPLPSFCPTTYFLFFIFSQRM